MQRKGLSKFGRGTPREHACIMYFKIHPLVQEKSFKDFSIFSSGGHLVQWSETV